MLSTSSDHSRMDNLFIVGTSYQLITSLNIISNFYSCNIFVNYIFIEISSGTRFNPDVPHKIKNIRFKKVKSKDWVNQIHELKFWKPNQFYFFQEASILNKYLAYHYKRKGATICLGPDGAKAYGLFGKKHEFLSMLKDTFMDYKFLIKNNFFLPKLYWSKNYRYGSFCLIDENWVPFKEIFNTQHNQSKGVLKELPDLSEQNLLQISNILKIKLDSEFDGNQCVIYFNQPLWSELLINKEIEILTELTKKIYEKKFYIKFHPSTKNEVINQYLKIPRVILIKDNVPAEFYIALSKNSIFITGWSTCLMHPISYSNRSFYLFPIFKALGDPILNQIQLIPFPHVKLVSNLREIVF